MEVAPDPHTRIDSPNSLRAFLRERELAERWNRSVRSLQRMRNDGAGPAFHRIGGSILYKIDDIEAYEASMRVEGVKQ